MYANLHSIRMQLHLNTVVSYMFPIIWFSMFEWLIIYFFLRKIAKGWNLMFSQTSYDWENCDSKYPIFGHVNSRYEENFSCYGCRRFNWIRRLILLLSLEERLITLRRYLSSKAQQTLTIACSYRLLPSVIVQLTRLMIFYSLLSSQICRKYYFPWTMLKTIQIIHIYFRFFLRRQLIGKSILFLLLFYFDIVYNFIRLVEYLDWLRFFVIFIILGIFRHFSFNPRYIFGHVSIDSGQFWMSAFYAPANDPPDEPSLIVVTILT